MAASDYVDQIQNLYIAYFGRPADPVGLAFWTEQVNAANGNLSAAIAGFATSTESGALYAGVSLGDKVTAIYQNLFNRAPEPTGLAFWVAKLVSGEISDAQAAYEILSAAGPGDAAAIGNKLSVAKAFTAALDTPAEIAGYNGLTAASLVRSFLSKVDSTAFTVNQATSALNSTVAEATGTGPQTVTPAPAPAPAAFTATLDTNTQAVTFGGTATGDISVSWAGNDATFSRDSNKATAVTFGGQGATSITLATGQALVAAATDVSKLGDFIPNGGSLSIGGTGLVKLTDTTLQASTVKTLDTQITPTLDLTSATRLTGTVADVITVTVANGNTLNLANTLNLTVSDTALNFATGKISATSTSDALTVTDSAQNALSLAAFTGFETITLNGSSATITLADGKAAVSSTTAVDLQLGSGGQTFTSAVGGNTLGSGAGNDTFKLTNTTGTNTITGLATGDALEVASGGTVVANGISSFVATTATVNNGSVTLSASSLGSTLDVSKATGSNGFTLNGQEGADVLIASNGVDTLTGGAGDNVFQFANSQFKAADAAGLLAQADTITDWTAAQSNNKLKFDTVLTVQEHATAATAGTASINAQGLATFDAADTSLAQKLDAVVNAVGTDAIGTSVVFNDGTDSYLFVVGDTAVGVQAGDALIKLTGANGALGLVGGEWIMAV